MDRTYPISPTLWYIRWLRHSWHPRGTQRHGIFHTHITLSRSSRWSRICTITPGNLQNGLRTSVWVATKHYRQYIIIISAPPLHVWTPLFKEPHTHGKVGHHPREVRKLWHPHMCVMHVCQVCLQTMVWALQKYPTQFLPSHQPWSDSLGGPASVANSRASGTDDCHPH